MLRNLLSLIGGDVEDGEESIIVKPKGSNTKMIIIIVVVVIVIAIVAYFLFSGSTTPTETVQPVTQAPSSVNALAIPVTQAPVSGAEASVTQAPVTQAPVTQAPSTTLQGRYIKLFQPHADYINLGEIQVFSSMGGPNIITSTTVVTASSLYSSSFPTSFFVDNNKNSWSATDGTANQSFVIDLGSVVPIYQINILNRSDCCTNRSTGIVLSVSNNADGSSPVYTADPITNADGSTTHNTDVTNMTSYWGSIAYYPPNKKPFGFPLGITPLTKPYEPSSIGSGRYIKLNQPTVESLNLSEIQVFSSVGGPNIITASTVMTKSSGYQGDTFPVANFKDNNIGNFVHSSNDDAPWLVVDLGSVVPIYQINIFNRTDCCTNRATGTVLTISNNADGSSPTYTAQAIVNGDGSPTLNKADTSNVGGYYMVFSYFPPNPKPFGYFSGVTIPMIPPTNTYIKANASGMWDSAAAGAYTCAGATNRNTTGGNNDFNNYCIFNSAQDAQNYCITDPSCQGYVTNSNSMFQLTKNAVANSGANGAFFKKQ